MKFYLSGQRTFENRGCEALVRSTVALIREQNPVATFLVPTDNPSRDAGLWPEAATSGVEFTRAYFPFAGRVWSKSKSLPVPLHKTTGWPFPMPSYLRADLERVDAVLAIGGDNYSLDYSIPETIMAVDRWAMDLGKPVYLWGASVGPFEREPRFKPRMARHLSRMRRIFVREEVSKDYLEKELQLGNVVMTADSAFSMSPEKADCKFASRERDRPIIGLNFSPLVAKKKFNSGQEGYEELLNSIADQLVSMGNNVVLIPHVFDGARNNDYMYMMRVFKEKIENNQLSILDSSLNAPQLKYAISKLDIFIGARTHATIAAFSTGVPTISLSYSVKATGINRALFGHLKYALPISELNVERVRDLVLHLGKNSEIISNKLSEQVSSMKKKGADMARIMLEDVQSLK